MGSAAKPTPPSPTHTHPHPHTFSVPAPSQKTLVCAHRGPNRQWSWCVVLAAALPFELLSSCGWATIPTVSIVACESPFPNRANKAACGHCSPPPPGHHHHHQNHHGQPRPLHLTPVCLARPLKVHSMCSSEITTPAVLADALMGIETIGVEIENPFGHGITLQPPT